MTLHLPLHYLPRPACLTACATTAACTATTLHCLPHCLLEDHHLPARCLHCHTTACCRLPLPVPPAAILPPPEHHRLPACRTRKPPARLPACLELRVSRCLPEHLHCHMPVGRCTGSCLPASGFYHHTCNHHLPTLLLPAACLLQPYPPCTWVPACTTVLGWTPRYLPRLPACRCHLPPHTCCLHHLPPAHATTACHCHRRPATTARTCLPPAPAWDTEPPPPGLPPPGSATCHTTPATTHTPACHPHCSYLGHWDME